MKPGLDPPDTGRRLVIDTKFTSMLRSGRFGNATLESGYLYQMYAYLRSQEGRETRWDGAAGLLLHPSIGEPPLERVIIQDHSITFATVDLSAPASAVRKELRDRIRTGHDDGYGRS